MAETHDTIKGLLAEFRGYSAGMPASYHVTMSWADFRKMLTRFEWAHDHDIATATEASARAVVGACVKQQESERNCAKLRDALQKAAESAAEIMERVRHKDGLAFNTANYIAGIAKDALAAEKEGGAK